MKILVSI